MCSRASRPLCIAIRTVNATSAARTSRGAANSRSPKASQGYCRAQLIRNSAHPFHMPLIIILIVLLLIFGGGGYYMGPGLGYYGGGGISIVLAIIIIYLLFGRGRSRL